MEALHIPVYSTTGDKVGTADLSPTLFGIAFNDAVVQQVVTAQMANSRQVLAHTKGRGDVRGGGKKPWKQKGTGRARHGSRRSPIWVGGGITFGPTKERNFSQKINKKLKQQALKMVLSDKATSGRLVVVKDMKLDEAKTKKLATILNVLPSKGRQAVLVTSTGDAALIRASRNIPHIQSLGTSSLNVLDLLKREYIIIPDHLLPLIEERYGA